MTTNIKHIILGTLLISFSSLQVAQADDALDRTIVPAQGEQVATVTPTIGDIYRQCFNGAEYVGTKAADAQRELCIGFMAAATQSASNNGNGVCPPLSYRQILAEVNTRIENNDEWKKPALPFLVASLQVLGCKKEKLPDNQQGDK
ncbi:hypothetical protein [Serratia sp. M24T3]|uniref:Rap1a immunity protein domain-containing protein n=1 Tax=Rouxiella sp. WC2420 TaxID=3234145 RepID=A0AB39VWU7_9GAMM|nr:hypothetical protein [Serratia sp. M24T3]EIC84163.1 hypothetical protein SPM24T3_12726 [Serratia sp. M24T3]